MKKIGFLCLGIVAACLVALFCIHGAAGEGAALAMFIPMMPKIMGQRLLNRAIMLNDGTWGPGGDMLDYPTYDRLRMDNALGTGIRSLFKAAVGTQREGFTLTYADTNIEKSDGVPSSQKWTFHKLTLLYQAMEPRTDAEIQLIMDYFRTTTMRFIVNSKDDMFRLPLWNFMGPTQLVSAPAATINSRFPQGVYMGEWEIKIPIVLQALTSWELRIEPQVASAAGLDDDFIGFVFDGQRDRKN